MELKDLGLQRINLDLSNNITENFFAKEGDVGTRGLSIKVLNNSVEIDTTGVSITMYARVGQEVYSVDATVKDALKGEYELIYPTSILKSGIVYAELQLKKLTNIISTKKFKILVESGIVTDSAIEGHDSYPIFEQLLEAGANEIARIDAENLRGVRLTEVENDLASHKENYTILENMVSNVIDNDITNVLNNELVATDIANKLNVKEVEYAPRLINVESQLAQTAKEAGLGIQMTGKNIEESFSGAEDYTHAFQNDMTGFVLVNDGAGDIEFSILEDAGTEEPIDPVITKPTQVSEWEVGTIAASTGNNGSGTNRIRTIGFYELPPSTSLIISWKTGLKGNFFQYTEDNVFISTTGFMHPHFEILTAPNARKYRFLIEATDVNTAEGLDLEIVESSALTFVVKPEEVFKGQFLPFGAVAIKTESKYRAYGSR